MIRTVRAVRACDDSALSGERADVDRIARFRGVKTLGHASGLGLSCRVRREYFLGPPLVTFAWIVAIAVIASGAVVAISRRRGADRTAIIDRLKVVGLTTAVGTVAVLTLQPGPGGVGSALPAIPNPVSAVDRLDLLQNVLLYLPVGFLAALVWSKSELIVARATVFAFCVSFSIEFAQWILPISRSAQTRDLILNTLGGFLGAMGCVAAMRFVHRPDAKPSNRIGGPT